MKGLNMHNTQPPAPPLGGGGGEEFSLNKNGFENKSQIEQHL